VAFSGRLGGGGDAEFPFRVTSHDWQESDRLLVVIMTALSDTTRAIEVGGRGRFDGRMTGSFSSPRIEGRFDADDVHVWDVTWGAATADIVIEGGYVQIAEAQIGDGADAWVRPAGRFALGFRDDGTEEIDADVAFLNWPMADLRQAFRLDDWSMDGTVAEAALSLGGSYREMFGGGSVTVTQGEAWGERFERATADVELEGSGMLIRRLELQKGPGLVRGSARIGWNSTYAFNADGEDIPVEQLDNFSLEGAPLTGRLTFNASGAGEFVSPSYAFDGAIDDLFVGNEGIGAVTGRLVVEDGVLGIERILVASSRLIARVGGTIDFDENRTADLDLQIQQAALDPYLKFVLANDVSPYTRITAAGSLAVQGPLADPSALDVTATISQTSLTLPNFELASNYELTNAGPIQLAFTDGQLRITEMNLQGGDTNLTLSGGADTNRRAWALTARGNASLSILQLFFGDLTASGRTMLNASLVGSFDAPQLTGRAAIADGRLRPLESPHSLESVNGEISFGSDGIGLNGLRGRVANGDVEFGGTITLDRYMLSRFNLTATGRSMRLRYPEGFNSTVDMDLVLTGPYTGPVLAGTVDVLRVSAFGQLDPESALLGFSGGGLLSENDPPAPAGTMPLALDIQVTAPRLTFINTRTARVEGRADLQVRGTFDRPQLSGSIEILGGEFLAQGNRYFVREGFIDFTDPERINPIFDVAVEARPRASGQTFTINARATGTVDRLSFSLDSDPWLPVTDIVRLLLGDQPNLGTAEQRALASSQEGERQMLQTVAASLLTSVLVARSGVGSVFESTGAVDTVQITPLIAGETTTQLDPGARITLGKRISPRVFLTYSRTLNEAQEEIILIEYDQSDRISWVLSRNEDRTFALDLRVRYVF